MLMLIHFLFSFTIITNLIRDINCTNVNDLNQDEIHYTVNQLMETDIHNLCQHKFLFSKQWYSVYSKTLAPRICRYYTQSEEDLGEILEKAALNGDLPVVKYLLNENRFTLQDRNQIKQNINVVLESVCGNGFHVSPSLVRDTFAEKSNIDASSVRIEILGFLLENGADIHANKDQALLVASLDGHLDVVKFLVKKGADIHADDEYAFRFASQNGRLDVVMFLVKEGANVNASDDQALSSASEYGHLAVVKFLVKKGADIHANDDYALRLASQNGHLDVVKFLIRKGANIHADDDSALLSAYRKGHNDVVNFLVENGANILVLD